MYRPGYGPSRPLEKLSREDKAAFIAAQLAGYIRPSATAAGVWCVFGKPGLPTQTIHVEGANHALQWHRWFEQHNANEARKAARKAARAVGKR